jgi:predicted ester cyclase
MEQLIQASSGDRWTDRDSQARDSEPTEGQNAPTEQMTHRFDARAFLQESVQAIWNQKMLGRILDLYAAHAPVHLGVGECLYGSHELLDRTVQWLAAFPDLRVFIDDVICAQRAGAYLSSLRWTAVGHNTGPSACGAATGRQIVVSGIANARIDQGRYVEQWIELGEVELVRQLGFDERSVLQHLWLDPAVDEFNVTRNQGIAQRPIEHGPEGHSTGVGALILRFVDTVWNQRQLGEVERFFAPSYRQWGPGSRVLYGREDLQTDIVSLFGAFPDLQMHIDDLFWEGDQRGGYQSSTRWTLLGTNSGPSAYGPPTNDQLRLSGITNHRIEGEQFVEGWTAYSEVGLARRLLQTAPTGVSRENARGPEHD